MPQPRINLFSDTQTQPTAAMREAMAGAPVGDEQRGEDPSVNELCERVAVLLGKEAAVFLPSGTMCNQIAVRVHCRPGDEVITDRTSHLIHYEAGGSAALSGVMFATLVGRAGVFTAEQAEAAIREDSRYAPRTRLVAVEQTANRGGGTVWPLETLRAVGELARRHRLATHMDGARLLNAVVATGVAAWRYAELYDTVWIDLSKGLGCPVGGVLATSRDLIEEVWRWKHRLGGAMRQAGIIAAAGIYALEHHVERLAEDHDNARRFAEEIAVIPGVEVDPAAVHTNIVYFDLGDACGMTAAEVSAALARHGIDVGATGPRRLRAVTHLDVTRDEVVAAAAALRSVIEAGPH